MPYKIIVAGSRTLTDITQICPIIEEKLTPYVDQYGWREIEIVSGTADGVDKCGEIYASGYQHYLKRFPADWTKYGKAAGPIRNKEMAVYADMALVIWDGKSSGSRNMIETMRKMNKLVIEVVV